MSYHWIVTARQRVKDFNASEIQIEKCPCLTVTAGQGAKIATTTIDTGTRPRWFEDGNMSRLKRHIIINLYLS